ncbi:hypothetical protein MYAM1_001375 [Malassezia yamatoensis]|uniref:NAD-dependent epimerase/dehydratase domain-containing protein n=1 Tax=Malassezia yamatoensis TaxID=253288 RepID=A0AAJ5YQK1_9BASI|nr:hypothetical protein MYAM1_001375 [Malassezia yamatoensis]
MSRNLLVVGGNGFVGSAVCKQALSQGWDVQSISGSGRPFKTPKGHAPAWTESDKMHWHKADALQPSQYKEIAASCNAVVHTVGILMETKYKGQGGSVSNIFRGLTKGWGMGDQGNPLDEEDSLTYERMNRDTAITVASTFAEAQRAKHNREVPFVYISAEDILRPVISPRYSSTKRDAEVAIAAIAEQEFPPTLRAIFMRPGFMYHPHIRPWTTLPATLIDVSAYVHSIHRKWRIPIPSPADILASRLMPQSVHPLAGALTTPPLHVDTVALAIINAIENEHVRGAQGVEAIKQLAGWPAQVE